METAAARHTAEALASRAATLVTLPDVYWQVKRIIDDPDTSHRDLARAIVTDPGMTARVLRLVNSAHFGLHGRIESVGRAVALLGMLHIHDLVLATSLATSFRGIRSPRMNMSRFWQGSIYRASSAAAMARSAQLADAERLFVEGLLSDIGHLVMYQEVPELAAAALERSTGDSGRLPEIERELIGCDYASVGGALTAAWGLPDCFRHAIAWQNHPEKAGKHVLEAALLHIAGRLAEQLVAGRDTDAASAGLDPLAVAQAGLTHEQVTAAAEEARTSLSALDQLLATTA